MSIIEGAADGNSSRQALGRFIEQYGVPLQQYLVRCCKLTEADAEEVLHDFLLEKLLGGDVERNVARKYLKKRKSAPDIRFRAYLLLSLRNYATDRFRSARLATVEWSELDGFDPMDERLREEIDVFNVQWAHNLLHKAIKELRREYQTPEQSMLWTIFELRVLRPTLEGAVPIDYATLCTDFGLESPKQAANRLQTVIRRFRSVLSQLIVDYLPSTTEVTPAIIESEINDLRQALGRSAPKESSASTADDLRAQLRLLELSDAGDQIWDSAEHPSLWQHLIALPLSALMQEIDPFLAKRYILPDQQWSGQSLRDLQDLWNHDNPPTEVLEALKRSARGHVPSVSKGGLTGKSSELPTIINAMLYLACTAKASLTHGIRLSSDEDSAFIPRIRRALQVKWLDGTTRELLTQWLRRIESTYSSLGKE